MPITSKKQERFIQAIAHNKAFAKKAGVKQSVAGDMLHPKTRGKNKKSPTTPY
jgi:hypothetical protein